MSHGGGGQGNTNGAHGCSQGDSASTCSTRQLPGGHQRPLGHQAAAQEGRGKSLGLVDLCRKSRRAEWVWDCYGVKTLDQQVEPKARMCLWGGYHHAGSMGWARDSSQLLCPSNIALPTATSRDGRGPSAAGGPAWGHSQSTHCQPHSAALLHPPLAAEIHIAHVHETTFHRWYHTAVALESSHISEALHQLVSSPSAPGSRAGQRSWWSFCEASLSLCYAKS